MTSSPNVLLSSDAAVALDRSKRWIGVDVGGTNVRAAIVEIDNTAATVGAAVHERTPEGGAGAERVIVDAVAQLIDSEGPVSGIGVGVAGHVNLQGELVQSAHTSGLVGVDLVGELSRFGVPVVVGNDANCVGLAAARLAFPDARLLLAVTLGTGIGGAIVIGGHLLVGGNGFGAEIGHMIIDRDGAPCACGQRGCWEVTASGSALTSAIEAALMSGELVSRTLEPGAVLTDSATLRRAAAGELASALAEGDPVARRILANYCEAVATGMGSLVQVLDPDVICLGGGVVSLGEHLTGAISAAFDRQFVGFKKRGLSLEIAPSGPDAGVIGAAVAVASSLAD